ncbi:MAG: amidohydrolase [Sutterellaceae bacterium]|nr:amidohydrolase [Sutterellaceae bacterium]MDY2868615.1 amidohydrolase [Mesosutterella sp.]
MDLKALEEKWTPYQIEMRRWFHRHPEPSEHEFETTKKIREELDKAGIEWKPCGERLSATGTLAVIHGGKPGKTFLCRGDIDGLSVTEKTGLPFASENPGYMHACGHDNHISMLLTAVMIANEIKDEIPGTIRFLFQPAEEVATGALDMMKGGALDGVDGAFGMHIWSELPAGKVSLQAGGRMGATDQFQIRITGKSGHAALPHKCYDATVAMAATIMNLQAIASRETNPVQDVVVTVGKAQSGTRFNVCSGSAVLDGTVRSLDSDVREHAEEAIKRIASMTAETFRCKAEVDYIRLCDNVVNDPEVTADGREAVKAVLGPDALDDTALPTMGGEDFGFFTHKVKAAFALFGTRNEACGACYPQHSDHYTSDESMLIKGALLHVQVALTFLNRNK